MSEQSSPLILVFVLVAVLVLAGALGYALGTSSTQIVNTGIWQMDISYQGIYVQTVADAYSLDRNDSLAAYRLSFICQENGDLQEAVNYASEVYGAQDAVKAANLSQLQELIGSGAVMQDQQVGVCSTRPIDGIANILRIVSPIGLVLMFLGIAGYGVLSMVRESEEEAVRPARATGDASSPAAAAPAAAAPSRTGSPAPATAAPAPEKKPAKEEPSGSRVRTGGFSLPFGKKDSSPSAPTAAQRGAQISAAVEKTDWAATGSEPPIVQFMTTYLHGDDLYDDSFSIEAPSGEFLGETGVSISDTIGSADTKNVSAFEIWLFDKNDIRTITKVLMSEHAYNDEAIRTKLAAKGEAVMAKPGEKVTLETATLRIVARVVDMAYGTDASQPGSSYYGRITIELAAWKRSGSAGGSDEPAVPSGRRGGV